MLMKLLLPLAVLLALATFTGCRSAGEPGDINHAAVQIHGRSLQQIQEATADVFQQNGYTQTGRDNWMMVFVRPGTQRDALKYGGWSGDGVTIRVRVEFAPDTAESYWVKANAYAEQNSKDPFFRDESRSLMLNRRPYQNLLNQVAKTLK